MHASEVTRETVERANELYWGSDKSVNQIADDLELSKGALYGIIEPEPSGLGCPLCGDEVVYPNRTAKDRQLLDCPTCDWDGTPDETTSHLEAPQLSSTEGTEFEPDSGEDVEDDLDLPAALPPRPFVGPSATTIAGGALLGAAAGLALVMWARRR